MIGVNLQLFDGETEQANLTGIQALWWNETEPKDGSRPDGKSEVVTTNSSGYINLDLSNICDLTIGDYGFLMLYKLDSGDHEDSLIFSGKVITSNIGSGIDMMVHHGTAWTKPADWPTLDTPSDGTQKIQGIFRVQNIETQGNGVAFKVAAAYTVDWGDGSAEEDFATGVTAEHEYDFSDVDLPSATSEGFKCAVITITPQTSNNITSVDFQVLHSNFGMPGDFGWLDLTINSEYLTSIIIAKSTNAVKPYSLRRVTINEHAMTDFQYAFSDCEALRSIPLFDMSDVTDTSYMFRNCYALEIIPKFDLSSCTEYSNMFYYCQGIKTIPKMIMNTTSSFDCWQMFYECPALMTVACLDMSMANDANYMFYGCYALEAIPPFDFSNLTDGSAMFYYCVSLTKAPKITWNTTVVDLLNLNYLFGECYSLKDIALSGMSGVNDASSMFYGCYSIVEVPLLDFSNCEDVSGMFTDCYNLTTVPAFDFSSATDFGSLFYYCQSLKTIPSFTMPTSAFETDYMFAYCAVLEQIPLLDLDECTNVYYMFRQCQALIEIPAFDFSNVTNAGSMFLGCNSLKRIKMTGLGVSFSLSNSNLGPDALDELYTNLPTATATVTVTGNWGTASDDPSIATAKNWTVTG